MLSDITSNRKKGTRRGCKFPYWHCIATNPLCHYELPTGAHRISCYFCFMKFPIAIGSTGHAAGTYAGSTRLTQSTQPDNPNIIGRPTWIVMN